MNPLSLINGASPANGATAGAGNVGSMAMPILAFVAILALIPLVLWLTRRLPQGLAGSRRAAPCPMKVVSSLALAPNQRLVTVEVGQAHERRWLVLGVSPGGIQALHQLTPPPAAGAAMADTEPGTMRVEPAFAQVMGALRQAQQGPGQGHGPGSGPSHGDRRDGR